MRGPGRCFVALTCALLLAEAASAQEAIVRGREYYLRYCAPCHGNDGGGRGPLVSALKASPLDLRYLGERYGMPLPTVTIARFIDGRQDVAAHRPRDMPVWGRRFYEVWAAKKSGEGDLQTQIRDIAQYLNAIQEEPHLPETPGSPMGNH
jgi:mono/diheme cytochrome c family protein